MIDKVASGRRYFPELGNENIHATGGEITVILPHVLQGDITLEDIVLAFEEQAEQLALLGRELLFLTVNQQPLVLVIQSGMSGQILVLRRLHILLLGSAEDGVDFQLQHFHAERLGDVIIRADGQAFDLIFLQRTWLSGR
jgi:hypothetical protein